MTETLKRCPFCDSEAKIIDAEFEELDALLKPKERIFPLTAFLMGFNLALVLMFIGRM